ncbi:hypothetical protein Tco_0088659 [Tanacetum coccineum]
MSLDEELAHKLYEEEQARFNAEQEAKFNAEQEELLASETTKDEANPSVTNVDWDDVQAQIQADEDLAQRMLEEERESLSIAERARLLAELIDKRKKLQAAQRYEVTLFVPMDSVMEKERTKRAGLNLQEESSKRQKTREGSKPTKEPKADEISQEDLQQMMMVVLVEEVYIEALQVKYPIIDWEVYSEDTRSTTEPTDDKEKELWVELKRLFEPDNDDTLWKLQRYMHDPLVWRLYDTCGVHHVSSVRGHDIFMLVEKEYPLTRGLMTVMLANKLQVDQYSEMANELLRKIFILANKPRH